MAILQLSKITNRKGLATDIPQLAGAELGWALDERKLFIGNGTIVDGAPVLGNTEILTEFSDILGNASAYTYEGSAAGYVVVTGENNESVVRSLQSKFDDIVSVKDFGAIGDGVTDDTDAINRALFQLFCRATNAQIRRSLFFPAGVYKVSGSIKIPPYAKLYGEGISSSIINFAQATPTVATAIVAGKRYIIDTTGTTDFTLIGAADSNPDTIFVANATPGTGTGTARLLAEFVVETADSLQQTGLNIGTNAATPPTDIEMITMAIYSEEENTLLKLDSVTNSGFSYVGLHGPRIASADVQVLLDNPTSAIHIETSKGPVSNVTLNKLDTQGTTYGLRAEGETKGIVLENSGLTLHYKGVYVTNPTIAATAVVATERYKIVTVGTTDFTLSGAAFNRVGETFTANAVVPIGNGTVIALASPGPTGVVVSRNIFDEIAREGVHYENVLFNSTGYNVFYDVANDFTGSAVYPVITFDTDQCVSVGDLFAREDETASPRVSLAGNGGIYIDGAHSIHLGSYERQVGLTASLTPATSGDLFNNIAPSANSYKIDYSIANATDSRIGTITVSVFNNAVTYSDDFNETAVLDIVLDVIGDVGTSNSTLSFVATGADAIMNFSVVRLD